MRSDTDKLPLSSSQGDEISDTVKLLLSSSQVSVVIPLLELKKATKSMRDGSNISSYLFHWNQLFPWPQSGMFSTVKALCFEVQLPKPSQELFQCAQGDHSFQL
ncbi:hypothetical protein ACFX2J_035480 [Malus domestica]